MRIAFFWSRYSGYMADCWRALEARGGCDVHVVAFAQRAGDASDPQFAASLLDGMGHTLLDDENAAYEAARQCVREFQPDVVATVGWLSPGYTRAVVELPRTTKVVVGVDNPLRFSWRQKLARFAQRKLFQRADLFVGPGERTVMALRYMGVPEHRIARGLYGVNAAALGESFARRDAQSAWPQRFGFVGRYNKRKGLDVLLDAQAANAARLSEPWSLECFGIGPLAERVATTPHAREGGFLAPTALAEALDRIGCFVMPSREDHWPLAIVEACAAGLPVICTSACGSSVELVRHGYNGWIVPPDDAGALADAMAEAASRGEELREMGRRSRAFAAPYSTEQWATRWARLGQSLLAERA